MPILASGDLTIALPPVADTAARRDGANRHFGDVSTTYRSLRDADLAAVGLVSGVLASAAAQARPFRLLDVGTGTGRYLDMVSERLSSTGAPDIFSIGLDRSPAMLRAQQHNGFAYPGASRLVGAVETLPFYDASCDAITSFNAVHHFDLATFASEAARVLSPSGFLVLYTRTAEQNRNTIWGRFFPEFATLETRLHSASELQEALDATHAFVSVRVQMIPWSVTTSLSRLLEQVTAYHYSTFRFYSPDRLRAARDTFQCRLRDVFGDCSRITSSNDHLLVVAQRAGRSANRQNVVRPLDCAGRLAINGQIFGRHDATGDDHG